MKNKKIKGIIAGAIVALVAVGGTFAWFTSSDSVKNPFSTGSTSNPGDPNAGIKIEENFKEANNILPGTEVNKDVWIESKASYNQLLRVKVKKVWKNPANEKEEITHYEIKDGKISYNKTGAGTALNNDLIILEKNSFSSLWDTTAGDGWVYYKGVLGPHTGNHGTEGNFTGAEWGKTTENCRTDKILDSVTLSDKAGNEYKNLKFEVVIEAESIQAANGAVNDAWADAPESIKALDGKDAGTFAN